MAAKILDGKMVSQEILKKLKEEVAGMAVIPKLAVILVGEDEASLAYVRQKEKACEFTGIAWEQHNFEADVKTEELIAKIKSYEKKR